MRLHPAAFGDGGVALCATRKCLECGDLRADLLAQLLGVGVQIDVELAHPGARGDVDNLLRVVGRASEAGRQHQRAAVVDVGVVLPGEPDTAVYLDAVLGAALPGGRGEGRGHRRRELESAVLRVAFAGFVDGTGGVPHRGGRPLGVRDHLRTLVLDGLELPDRPAELLADLGVRRRGVGGPPGHADRLRGQQGGHQRAGEDPAQVAQHAVVADLHGIGADMSHRSQRVDAAHGFDLQLVGVDHHPLFAAVDRHRKHQHRRLGGGGHRPHLATDDQAVAVPGRGQAGVDRVRGDHLACGQVVQQLGLGVVRSDQRAGDRRGDERPRHRAVAELG